MQRQSYIYFLTNTRNTVLYIGVTNNLKRRVFEHRKGFVKGFTSKYMLYKLIYFEVFEDYYHAIEREKQLKGWRRSKKDNLIRGFNPK